MENFIFCTVFHWTATLIRRANEFSFYNKTNGPKSRNAPDTPDFWLENKMFHNSFRVFIITSVFFKSASLAIITEITGLSTFYVYFVWWM